MTISRKEFLIRSAAAVAPGFALAASAAPSFGDTTEATSALPMFSVLQFGAKGDGKTKDTRAIQAAIDAAGKAGGTVVFPAGNYLCGPVRLRSAVSLHLTPGSILTASPDKADFDPYEKLNYKTYSDAETSYFNYALIRGEEVENISITGSGTIDGNRNHRGGPKPIALKKCRMVSIRDITMRNAPNYNISLLGCDYVDISGVTIFNGFADGIDPDCSKFVRIANCYIETWDDAIVPKTSPSLGYLCSTENVTVTNCVLTTACYALKLGTESSGDFKNIAFSNCTIFSRRDKWNNGPLGGVAILSVDGANIDRVVVSNIAMDDVLAPIFIRLGGRGRAQEIATPGTLQNVSISNISATDASLASSITGVPGRDVGPVWLQDVHISAVGKGRTARLEVPENVPKYPEVDMFGDLPCYGLYCRHANGLTLDRVDFALQNADERPAVFVDGVKGLDLVGFRASPTSSDQPVIVLHDVQQALMQGARAIPGTRNYLQLAGEQTREIRLLGNDFRDAQEPIIHETGAAPDAIIQQSNLTRSAK